MSAYTMVSSDRSEINIAHYDGNYYAILAHRPGDEEPSEIYLTVPQMPELARMLTDYVVAMIPLHGLGARRSLRARENPWRRCRTICAMTCPIRRWPVMVTGSSPHCHLAA